MTNQAKIEIKSRWTGKVLFSVEAESVKQAVVKAVKDNANLGGANLRDAYLGDANLGGANLRDADLGDANLRGAYLRGADLSGAYLRGAYLRDAYLGGAYLRDAYLGGANLRGADLSGVYLGGAYLRDAYLGGAKNYSDNHDVFAELVRRQEVKVFVEAEWSFIGQIIIHRLCWDSIKKRFGDKLLRVLEVLKNAGFGEYYDKYREVLGDD